MASEAPVQSQRGTSEFSISAFQQVSTSAFQDFSTSAFRQFVISAVGSPWPGAEPDRLNCRKAEMLQVVMA
jgi:hypothetical protein